MPFYSQERDPVTNCTGGLVDPGAGLDGEIKVCAHRGFKPRTIHLIAILCVDYTREI